MVFDSVFSLYQDWETLSLGEVCQRGGGNVQTGPFGSQLHASDYVAEGIPSVMPQNIGDNKILDAGIARITEADAQRLSKYRIREGDIIYSRRGDVERRALVRKSEEGWLCGTGCLRIRFGEGVVYPRYAAHYLGHPAVREWIVRHAHGATMPNLNTTILSELPFVLPPWAVQVSIGDAIELYDQKIDLNRRLNQTLEAMAQAIFKSWFVDFDPVKARIAAIAQGQDPLRAAMRAISGKTDAELDQMPREHHNQLAATAALFPDAMEESELGEIPKGWTPTPIRDVAEVVKGKSYSSKDLVDNDQAALVTLKSFERGGGFRMDGFKPYVGPYKPEQVVLPGDLIVAYTDVTQAAELIGKPAVVVGVDHFKTLVASLDVGIIRPLNKRVSRQFLYGLFMTDAFQSHTFAHTSGTTVLHLSKEGVPSYSFACPDERLVSFFSETAEAMAMEKQRLIDQNRSLATLRDALLPKLLSGEFSVENLPVEAAH